MTDTDAREPALCPDRLPAPHDRRQFLRLAAAGAAGALIGLHPASADTPPQAYLDQMDKAKACKGAGDFAGMAAAIRDALREWRGDEYAWRSLAWALGRAGEFEESLAVARENVRRNGEGPWSLAQLADSGLLVHDADVVYGALSRAKRRFPNARGEAVSALRDGRKRWLGMFGAKRISVTWTVDPQRWWISPPDDRVWIRLPQLRHPRQDVAWEVLSGGTDPALQRSWDVDYLRLRFRPEEPIVIRTDILVRNGTVPLATLRRTSLRNIPPRVKWEFLGESADVPILPNGPVCQELIGQLRGASPYETIDNILRWFRDNFTYKDNPTQDSEGLLKEHFGGGHHYSVAVCALARAAGIPARIVGGEVFGWANENDKSVAGGGSHGWVEVYLNPLGWVELDGLGYDTFGAIHRDIGTYVRFHTVGRLRNPLIPHEYSLQGSQAIEGKLLEVIPARVL